METIVKSEISWRKSIIRESEGKDDEFDLFNQENFEEEF